MWKVLVFVLFGGALETNLTNSAAPSASSSRTEMGDGGNRSDRSHSDYSAPSELGACGGETEDEGCLRAAIHQEVLQKTAGGAKEPESSKLSRAGSTAEISAPRNLWKLLKRKRCKSEWDFGNVSTWNKSALVGEMLRVASSVRWTKRLKEFLGSSASSAAMDLLEWKGQPVDAVAAVTRGRSCLAGSGCSSPDGAEEGGPTWLRKFSLTFHSLTSSDQPTLSFESVLSTEPLVYKVLLNGQQRSLLAFPLRMSRDKLRAAVTNERHRAHSFARLSALMNYANGYQLTKMLHWNLMLDAFALPSKRREVALPNGEKVINYFVLMKPTVGTLRDFSRNATTAACYMFRSVFVGRVEISVQVINLMSMHDKKGIWIPNLSLDSFDVDPRGNIYLSSSSLWYRTGTYYHIIDKERGFYAPATGDPASGATDTSLVYIDGRAAADDVVRITLAIWCGESLIESPAAIVAQTLPVSTARFLARIQGEFKCLPAPVANLLQNIAPSNEGPRVPLSEVCNTPTWLELLELRDAALQL